MKLTSEQFDLIKSRIDSDGITIDTLKDDLLDHLCCVVEDKMNSKEDFHNALKEALHELAPQGLQKIQDETVFLLNSNKIVFMKKLMFSIGLISAVSMSMGTCFKFLHMPGADELMNYGFGFFVLVYLPMMMIDRFKSNIESALSEKLKLILGFLSGLLTATSIIFKLYHYQGAAELLMAGAVVFSFGFLPFLFFSMYKRSVG